MQSVYTLSKLAQLRWSSRVTRMPDERLPMITSGGKALTRSPKRNLTKTLFLSSFFLCVWGGKYNSFACRQKTFQMILIQALKVE